jgi:MFS transporter, ACS family, hexuronate transporter
LLNHPPQPTRQADKRTGSGGRVRWWIGWTLFFSTVTNYVSRQTFSVLSPVIVQQYHLNHAALARILGAFQISYALTWLLGGFLLDIVGTRLCLALAATLWSVVNILTGLANSVFAFTAFRFLLGIGEGFNWPGASKTVAEWFPNEERSVAVALFDSGSSIGGAVAAIVIPVIALSVGWRWSFVFSGVISLVWVAVWLRVYHPLDRHPRVSREEQALIREGQDMPATSEVKGAQRWIHLAKNRNTWAIILGRVFTEPIWWFFAFWLPQYLSDARGFSLKRIALFAWIPFVAADLGNFTGGLLSGYWVRRGWPVVRARTAVCVVSCLPILAGIPAATVHNAYLALALICVALWGYASWATMGLTLPSDLFPQDVVATVTGLSGFSSGIASTLFTFAVGFLVDRFSYRPAFVVAALLPLSATACLLLLVRPDHSNLSPTSSRAIEIQGG